MTTASSAQTVYLKDYQVPEFLIDDLSLRIELDTECTLVYARLTLRRNPHSPKTDSPLILQGEKLKLIELKLDAQTLGYQHYQLSPENLTIPDIPENRSFTLEILNEINPAANTALEGLYLSGNMLCTQCEAEGFRKITYFIDRPDVMSRYQTTLVADKTRHPVLLSNGNKIGQGELDNNRHWVSWEDPFKKPSYLFALVAGQLECIRDHFVTMSGRTVTLEIYVEAHDVDKCAHAMQSLKNAMRWDEQAFGREYDLDLYMIVAVGHFNMGAMENKGLNIFNTKFVLARPDTATDADYEQIEGVIGHEYFHNWSGNRVTCRDWFQLSLKEGFTVFRDQQFTADHTSPAVKRIEDVNNLRIRQFPEDSGPLAHPIRPESYIEINNFYTTTVYEKGAEVVRMLHTIAGPEGFRKGCDLYFERHDGQAVTCEDFVLAMETANQIDLEQFRHWYAQAGTPELKVRQEYDSDKQKFTLHITQSCPPTPGQAEKPAFHIPIKVGLLDSASGAPLACAYQGQKSTEVLLHLQHPEQSFIFEQVPQPPIVSLLRGFSAPVKLHIERNAEELAFLLKNDPDSFNRWEAGTQLSRHSIFGIIESKDDHKQNLSVLVESFRHLLNQSWEDLSYLSLLLSLPSEIYLAGEMRIVDPERIHLAREFTAHTLAEQLESAFCKLYLDNHRGNNARFDSQAIGQRRIKNVALGYLGRLQKSEHQAYAVNQFRDAKTMTDQISALSTIVNFEHPEKQDCLNEFYQRWQNEPLVIDKWFALQACSSNADTFNTVTKLLRHPAFDLKNPNRVRSLIGAFTQQNPRHFHDASGQGYRFLGDKIIELNDINPQVASRMVSALTQWRRYDSQRQALMQAQLERIIACPHISRDVYEIVSKSL